MPDQPPQQAPPVQRLRIRYAKRGRLRFTSHRDFARAFERALVRAAIPMAYSSGFHPHPRISYAGAAPTGSASEAEYLELALAEVVVPAEVHAMLDEALPPGLDVLEVVPAQGVALAERMQASVWRLVLSGVEPAEVAPALQVFLDTPEVLVERMTKKGMREFDARAAVASLAVEGTSLDLFLHHTVPAVRPDDVLAGLREVAGLDVAPGVLAERRAQGPLDEETGAVGDPLAPDRDAV